MLYCIMQGGRQLSWLFRSVQTDAIAVTDVSTPALYIFLLLLLTLATVIIKLPGVSNERNER